MSLKRLLMCRPTHFKVDYAINPWMDTQRRVDIALAQKQWSALKATLEEVGASVSVLEPEGAEHYPDLVFAANAAAIRGKTAYLANFHYPERQGERYFYSRWFETNGFKVTGSTDIAFEGAGDALWVGANKSKLIVGVGPRTDARALADLADKLRVTDDTFKAYGFRLVDPRFYHIDTCFCPLTESLALYYPAAFDALSRHNLANEVELLPVCDEDAARFACNAVVVGKTVVMNGGSTATADALKQRGFTTRFVDMSEFIKSGGSAKCCTLDIS